MHAAIAVGGACELMVTITISMYRAESRGFRGVGEWFCENLGLNYRVKESGGEFSDTRCEIREMKELESGEQSKPKSGI